MAQQVPPERKCLLRDAPVRDGSYVLYWMQASQRILENAALSLAVSTANERHKPVLVCFALTDSFPDANLRHYRFMLEGIAEVALELGRRGIGFLMRAGDPVEIVPAVARGADLVVCDRGYLRVQREWRERVAAAWGCRVIQVEDNAVVPVETASSRREYAARTIRPRLSAIAARFTEPVDLPEVAVRFSGRVPAGLDPRDVDGLCDRLSVDRRVGPVSRFYRGGPAEALRRLGEFVSGSLLSYDEARNEPSLDATSHLSPYLHFGSISPVTIINRVRDTVEEYSAPESPPRRIAEAVWGRAFAPGADAYVEELVVRRELAFNYVHYTEQYDSYTALPDWARRTLDRHALDPRPVTYNKEQLEAAETHDPFWNAAMTEMRETGFMHNYMRMYWGKKVLEWTPRPEDGFETLLALNNRYFLDGRDPASYANAGWIFGLHDRPWREREIFGTVRYMSAQGLERKFNMQAYISRVKSISERVDK